MKNIFEKFIKWVISLFIKTEDSIIEEPVSSQTNEIIEEVVTSETVENKEEIIIEYPMEKELVLTLERIYRCSTYTIGKLFIDGLYICDTIEDTDRGLYDSMDESEIKSKKVFSETAIPYGTYNITMKVKSPKFSDYTKYKWAKQYNGCLPRLLNVKGFDGVLMHVGNTAKDTMGCLIVGENKEKGKVLNSALTFNRIMSEYLLPANEKGYNIKINIVSSEQR